VGVFFGKSLMPEIATPTPDIPLIERATFSYHHLVRQFVEHSTNPIPNQKKHPYC
jgi:hypothetical protein